MILSRKYKEAMNKITVDEQMKDRILKNINNINNDKEIEFNEHSKSKNTIIVKHKYYRNLGILAACCAIVIYTLNNKYIFDSHTFNRNSAQNTEIAFNESEESNETSKSRERIEVDLKNNEGSLEKAPDTSENSSTVDDRILNNDQINNSSETRNSVDITSNSQSYDGNSEEDNKAEIINENNYSNDNESSQNNSYITEDSNNTEEADTRLLEGEISQYSGDIISEASYIERGRTEEEFKTLDELKKIIDFTIKTPKIKSGSNEIKSIVMDSNKNISIKYENKDYSLIFKIKKEANEENLYKIEPEMEKVMNIDEKSVLLKGNSDLINIASWSEDNIYFEIESICGMKEGEIINIIKNIE